MLADEVLRVGERPFGSGRVRRPSGMYAVASVCEKSLARGPIVNKKKGTAESEKMTLTIWNEIWVCQSSQKESLKMDIMSLMRRSVCKSGWPLRLSASAAITSRAQ